MKRSEERFRTTHCGSLPRAPQLLALVAAVSDAAAAEDAEFDRTVREAVDDVVARQIQAGLTSVNDGEQSKFHFGSYFQRRLSGFVPIETVPGPSLGELAAYPEFFAQKWAFRRARLPRVVCTGRIAYEGEGAIARDIDNLQAAGLAAGADELFMSAVSPGTVLSGAANRHYQSEDDFHHALCDGLRVEYEAIARAGIVLQLDCPDLGREPRLRGGSLEDHARLVARNVELIDYATRNIAPEQMRLHVCWGADEAPHDFDPPLAAIVEHVLRARPQGLALVAANARHEHEWRVWQDTQLPDGKILIPGVIDSTTNIVEHPEVVADRIERFARLLGAENVLAGVDCGFGTVGDVDQVDARVVYAKLASLAAGAAIASQRLF
jgi:5-methyltetrahydropteroyltriglutamate--homocysteine methyltransferase